MSLDSGHRLTIRIWPVWECDYLKVAGILRFNRALSRSLAEKSLHVLRDAIVRFDGNSFGLQPIKNPSQPGHENTPSSGSKIGSYLPFRGSEHALQISPKSTSRKTRENHCKSRAQNFNVRREKHLNSQNGQYG